MCSIQEVSASGKTKELKNAEITFGRGPFLGVTDKRVSRNHGTLKRIFGGIELKSVHTNPCFYTKKSDPETWLKLDKGESVSLLPGDTFSLLPKQYIYRVIPEGSTKSQGENLADEDISKKDDISNENHESEVLKSSLHHENSPQNSSDEAKTATTVADDNHPQESSSCSGKDMIGGNQPASSKDESANIKSDDEIKSSSCKAIISTNIEKNSSSHYKFSSNSTETPKKCDNDTNLVKIRPKIFTTSSLQQPKPNKNSYVDEGKEIALPLATKRKLPAWMLSKKSENVPSSSSSLTPAKKKSSNKNPPKKTPKRRRKTQKVDYDSDENPSEPEIDDSISSKIKKIQKRQKIESYSDETPDDLETKLSTLAENEKKGFAKQFPKKQKIELDSDETPDELEIKSSNSDENKKSSAVRKNIPEKCKIERDSDETPDELEIKSSNSDEKKKKSVAQNKLSQNQGVNSDETPDELEIKLSNPLVKKKKSVALKRGVDSDETPDELDAIPSHDRRQDGNLKTNDKDVRITDEVTMDNDITNTTAKNDDVTSELVEMVDTSITVKINEPTRRRTNKDVESGEEDNSILPSSEANSATSDNAAASRNSCPYGSSCYRKNPLHFQEFSHPGDADYKDEVSEDESEKQECPFGTNCYRNNPLHKKQYKHTKRVAPKRRAKTKTSRKKDDDESSLDDYDLDDSFLNDGEEEDLDLSDEDSDWNPSLGSQSQKATRKSERSRKRTKYRESDSDDVTTDDDLDELVTDAKKFATNKKMWK